VAGKSFGYLPVYVAARRGFFQGEGFDADVTFVGGDLQPAALAAGEIDYAGAGGTLARAAVQGLPAKVITFLYDRPTWSLVARPDITSIAQLKGKTVGVSRVGVSDDIALRLTVSRFGLNGETDVTTISHGAQAVQTLMSGAVEAGMLNVDATAIAKAQGYNELASLADLFVWSFSGFAVSDRKLAQQRDQVKRYLRAQVKALQYMLDHEAEVVQVAVDEFEMEPSVTRVAVAAAVRSIDRGNLGGTTSESLRHFIDYELRPGTPPGTDIQPAQFVDLTALEEVQRELGLRRP
jgi:NitT/TauT family transport system substrate-binding protein